MGQISIQLASSCGNDPSLCPTAILYKCSSLAQTTKGKLIRLPTAAKAQFTPFYQHSSSSSHSPSSIFLKLFIRHHFARNKTAKGRTRVWKKTYLLGFYDFRLHDLLPYTLVVLYSCCRLTKMSLSADCPFDWAQIVKPQIYEVPNRLYVWSIRLVLLHLWFLCD